MKLFYGILIVLLFVFGSYIFKTLFGTFYKLTTGTDIGTKFYTTTKYGTHDYRYDFGKSVFSI